MLHNKHLTAHTLVAALCIALFFSYVSCEDSEAIVPDLGPNVRNAERAVVNDDPEEPWEEWNESKGHKNRFPKKRVGIEEGVPIESIIGGVMRQEKVLYAYLKESVAVNAKIGRDITAQYSHQMKAGGIGCNMWYVHNVGTSQRQIVLKCETVLDGHQSKNFLVTRPEIEKVVLDNLDFKPKVDDDDDEEDDEDSVKNEL